MSSAEKLYSLGVISLEECCQRLVLIHSFPPVRDYARFVKIDGGAGGEKYLQKKISEFVFPKEKIGSVNIVVRSQRGKFTAHYRNFTTQKEFRYPGQFVTREHAQVGVKYLVWAINEEIERRRKKLSATN